jgi:hypothetical protein
MQLSITVFVVLLLALGTSYVITRPIGSPPACRCDPPVLGLWLYCRRDCGRTSRGIIRTRAGDLACCRRNWHSSWHDAGLARSEPGGTARGSHTASPE